MPSAKELGALIKGHRIKQKLSVKDAAAAAKISRDTWKKIETGGSVQDAKRQAALELLGLDSDGQPDVSGVLQTPGQYVGATGERVVEGRREDSEVLQAIASMSARFDQLDAGQRDMSAGLEALAERTDARFGTLEDEQRELSRRLAELEESRP